MIDFRPIAKKIESMIKKSIKDNKLYKTGKLYRSISVSVDDKGTYTIKAEDYFTFLNEKHNILGSIFDSNELDTFIENYITNYIQQDLG